MHMLEMVAESTISKKQTTISYSFSYISFEIKRELRRLKKIL